MLFSIFIKFVTSLPLACSCARTTNVVENFYLILIRSIQLFTMFLNFGISRNNKNFMAAFFQWNLRFRLEFRTNHRTAASSIFV